MPDSQRIRLSPAAGAVLGISDQQRELTLKDLIKLASPDDREFLCSIIKSFQKSLINKFYFSVLNGVKELYLSVQVIAEQSEGNKLASPEFSGFVQDVTEIRQALKMIDDRNDQLNEMSWMQSHVIRAPVATVLGLLDMWYDADTEDDKAQIISWIKENMVKLDGIIKDMSDKTTLL